MKMKNTFLMRVLLCLCLICIYFAAILTPLSSFADDSIAQRKAKLTREVQTKKKMVALTFDDGPHPILTPKILDLLKKYHAKATFFVVGNKAEQFPDVLLRTYQEGHETGNHTYDHILGKQITADRLQTELEHTDQIIKKITGTRTSLYRPVGGYCNAIIMDKAEENQKTIILWSWHLDVRDWQLPPANYISSKIIQGVQPGNIILLHDWISMENRTSSPTVEALEHILAYLKKNGYECVTVSELLFEAQKKLPNLFDPK